MRLRTLIFALLLLSTLTASAYDAEVNDIYYNFSDTEAKVTYKDYSYNSYTGSIAIPATVTYNGTTYSVTSIGDNAFSGCSGLTEVTISNSVTSIGGSAFWHCSSLTSIEIPNSVTTIGSSAFSGCSGLTEVTIPNSVTSIGQNAFSGESRDGSLISFYSYFLHYIFANIGTFLRCGSNGGSYVTGTGIRWLMSDGRCLMEEGRWLLFLLLNTNSNCP